MSCINCKIKLNTNYSVQLCQPCYYDDTVTISSHDLYKNFYISQKDINDAMIPSIKGKHGEKMLLIDILELARILTENKSDASPKKKAYLKQKNIFDQMQQKKEDRNITKNNIKLNIIGRLPKYDIILNNEIELYIDNLINTNVSLNDITNININNICNEVQIYNQQLTRRNLINNLITKEYDEKYIMTVNMYPIYNTYVNKGDISLNTAFDKIKNKIDLQLTSIKRKQEIDDLFESQLFKKDILIAKNHKNYLAYINDDSGTLEDNFDTIKNSIDRVNKEKKRKKELDQKLKLKLSNCNNMIKVNKIYVNYIKKGGNIEDIINKLVTYYNTNNK